MKQTIGIYLMFAGILMGVYLVFGVYLPTTIGGVPAPRPVQPISVEALAEEPVVSHPELSEGSPVAISSQAGSFGRSSLRMTDEPIVLAKYERPKSHSQIPDARFSVPEGLKKEVEFWKTIYGKYDIDQAVIHDPEDLGKVYGVITLPHCGEEPTKECSKTREDAVQTEKDALLAKLDPDGRKNLVLRAQVGQRDKFVKALKLSDEMLPDIEKVFDSYNIPLEVAKLPFVESMFNNKAYSKSGAAGIWQLMRASAKILGLKVGKGVDERFDPVKATQAAAKHLTRDYKRLGRWDLAINAYNVGPGRISDAIRQLGTTNIVKIIDNYDHPAYGFAARNFYPCFLAALAVYNERYLYFKDIYFGNQLNLPSPPLQNKMGGKGKVKSENN